MVLRDQSVREVQSDLTAALELLELLRLHDELENFLDNLYKEVVLDPLVEVLHVVELVVLLALLEVLHNDRRVQLLLVLVPEQVKQEVARNTQIKLLIVVLIWEATWPLIESLNELELEISLGATLPRLVE